MFKPEIEVIKFDVMDVITTSLVEEEAPPMAGGRIGTSCIS